MKSGFDWPAVVSSRFAPIDVAAATSCTAMCFCTGPRGISLRQKTIIRQANEAGFVGFFQSQNKKGHAVRDSRNACPRDSWQILPFAFCLLPFTFCLLPFAFCLL